MVRRRNSMPLWMENEVGAQIDKISRLKPHTKPWQTEVLRLWRRTLVWISNQNLNYPRPDIAEGVKRVLGVIDAEHPELVDLDPPKPLNVIGSLQWETLYTDQPAFPMMVINPETWDDWLDEMLQMRKGGFTPEWLGRLYNGEYIVRVDPRTPKFEVTFIQPQVMPRLSNFG